MPFFECWLKKKLSTGSSDTQAGIIEFLQSPAAYADNPSSVERIDTHGAVIFLEGERAYKLKRAVKLEYLDFSTLEKRRAALERELSLNSKTVPELYRRLIPVLQDALGTLKLGNMGGESDEVVDWVIEMNRFDQDQLFDSLAGRGGLDAALVKKLADAIDCFHRDAPSVRGAEWLNSLRRVTQTVKHAFAHDEFSGLELQDSVETLERVFERLSPLMHERRNAGFVRRCHGDLHLKNIVLIDGEPRLFDALEFNEDLATIDILYDLAFLLMDLCYRGLRDEANALLNHYFQHTHCRCEWSGLRLLPLFMAIRAGVRAMVGLDGLAFASGEERERLRGEMHDYARLFQTLLAPSDPRFVVIGGLSGTGKTTVAHALAPRLGAAPGAIHLRSDVERKLLFHAGITEHLEPGGYTEAANRMVYQRLYSKAEAILETGHSVILDATFSRPEYRQELEVIAARCGVELEALWLEADQAQMITRVTVRRGDASDADAEIVRRQLEESGAQCPQGWQRVMSCGGPEDTIGAAAKVLTL